MAARDIRSNLGSNLDLIRRESKLDPWESDKMTIQAALHFAERKYVPDEDMWRCGYLSKLLTQRLEHHYSGNRDEEERVMNLINSLVVN